MNADSIRTWMFRILVVAAAVFVVAVFLLPWWSIDVLYEGTTVIAVKNAFTIYAFGSRTALVQYKEMAEPYLTPLYQTVLAFVFLAVSVILILLSTWLKGRRGQWLLGLIGLIYLLYPLGTYLLIKRAVTAQQYYIQGSVNIQGGVVVTYFHLIYFLAFAAGLALMLLAVLRNVIAPGLLNRRSKEPSAGHIDSPSGLNS